MDNTEDFNNIKQWLEAKLAERKLSTSRLTLLTGNYITNATVFRWYIDKFRPSIEKMELICNTLSNIPVIKEGESPRMVDVPLHEGLSQYTPRVRGRKAARR